MADITFAPVATLSAAELYYNFADTDLGPAYFVFHGTNLVFLGFSRNAADIVTPILRQWPVKSCQINKDLKLDVAAPPAIQLHGTDFQIRVWRALCALQYGQRVSYGALGQELNSGARAVGRAVGANPVAWFVPCHRVIRQSGELGGYRWGLSTKQKLLEIESSSAK